MPIGDLINGFGNPLASGKGGGKCEYINLGFVFGVGDGINGLVESMLTGEFLGDIGEFVFLHISLENGVF